MIYYTPWSSSCPPHYRLSTHFHRRLVHRHLRAHLSLFPRAHHPPAGLPLNWVHVRSICPGPRRLHPRIAFAHRTHSDRKEEQVCLACCQLPPHRHSRYITEKTQSMSERTYSISELVVNSRHIVILERAGEGRVCGGEMRVEEVEGGRGSWGVMKHTQ